MEPLIKYLHRHAGKNDPQDVGNVARGQDCMDAGGRAKQGARAEEVRSDHHPVNNCFDWILACARMTTQKITGT